VHHPVLVSVMLNRFLGMIAGVQRVPVGDVGVVGGLLVIARLMMRCRFPVMFGRVLMMLRRLEMMFRSLVSH
jgi:hypothetical protein